MLINPIFPRGIKAGKSLPFYFILKVPPNAAAGEYNANVKIDIGNHSYEVPVTLTVWDFDIPLKHSIRTAYGEDYRILLGNTIENLVHLLNSGSNDAGYTDTSDAVKYDFIDYDTTQDVSDVLINAIASDDGYSGPKDGFSQGDLYWEDSKNEEAGVDAGIDSGDKDTSVAIDAVQVLDITGGGGEESSGCSCSFLQN